MLFNGDKTRVSKIVVQFGLAITPLWLNTEFGLTSGTTRGTSLSCLKALELSIKIAFCSFIIGNHFLEIDPPADAKTKSTSTKEFLLTSCIVYSLFFHIIFLPADLEEESRINSEIGKFLSARIFINSDPTAPEEPKTATFNGLFGNNDDLCKIVKNYKNI